jgi:hypothetical protein
MLRHDERFQELRWHDTPREYPYTSAFRWRREVSSATLYTLSSFYAGDEEDAGAIDGVGLYRLDTVWSVQ